MRALSKLAVLATFFATAGVTSVWAADFFPLETGNYWTYRNNPTGMTFTVRVGVPYVVNDKVYYALQGYVDSTVLVRVNERNNLVYVDNETNEERVLVSFAPFEGGWWHAPHRPCEQESQTQERRVEYNGPAGTFRDVLDIDFRGFSCSDAGTAAEQFAENIGMVRRVDNTIAGPRQYDLVFARIGNLTIDALPTARFSVAVDQTPGSDTMTAVIRIRSNSAPLKLVFPTAQEFEIVLRDENGTAIWSWSDGRFFDQATHNRTLYSDWIIAVPVPRPVPSSVEGAPRNYTLQAWLTTEGPAPRFAATVPVSISPQ